LGPCVWGGVGPCHGGVTVASTAAWTFMMLIFSVQQETNCKPKATSRTIALALDRECNVHSDVG
jgi:hypothetical protein